jgi:hypothetical protein
MARLSLTFKPDYDDYRTVNQAATFNKPTIILMILMGILSVATVLAIGLGWIKVGSERLLLYLLPPMMFVFFLIYTPINLKRTARKAADEPDETHWQVGRSGISVSKGESTTKYPWEALGYIEEIEGYFMLFSRTNRAEYIFIPKTAFADPAEEEAFRSLAVENLGPIKP